jgi:hypothetical protein
MPGRRSSGGESEVPVDGGGGNDGGDKTTPPPTLDLTDPTILALLGLTGGAGGGSSSSGGGGSAAPSDPQFSEAYSFYVQLWGRKPPSGYVEHFLDGSTDIFDFMAFQLSRPGARKTRFYANALSGYAAQAAQLMGRR